MERYVYTGIIIIIIIIIVVVVVVIYYANETTYKVVNHTKHNYKH